MCMSVEKTTTLQKNVIVKHIGNVESFEMGIFHFLFTVTISNYLFVASFLLFSLHCFRWFHLRFVSFRSVFGCSEKQSNHLMENSDVFTKYSADCVDVCPCAFVVVVCLKCLNAI